ncbi:solute carrier family 43 member 3-like [Acanthaster planci]|uniref:Solute carrier family 43 member 3-like n=1 Tax=Acanthaster planci TaxID=133434 RepID=A0A8B7ZBB3_ACAPL|nr:solute carrier family 43 member 3-like [Acanthaster planci]
MIGLTPYRVLTLGLGTFENLIFSGVVFGWASLVFIVKQEGYFSHLCSTTNSSSNSSTEFLGVSDQPISQSGLTQTPTTSPSAGTGGDFPSCPEQDAELQLVFTIATFCYEFLLFPMGIVLDKVGTLAMRLLSSLFILTGLLLIAFSSMETAYLLFPATSFLTIGGIELMFTNMQISSLFGRRKSTIMTFLSGCLDSSAFVFIVVKLLYENLGVPLQTSFFILAGICLVLCFNTLLLPKTGHIPYPLPPGYRQKKLESDRDGAEAEGVDNMAMNEMEEQLSGKAVELQEVNDSELNVSSPPDKVILSSQLITEEVKSTRYPSLRSCFLSWPALCLLIWFSLLQLNMFFFLGTINPGLERLTNNDQTVGMFKGRFYKWLTVGRKQSSYTTALAIFQACSIVVAPLCGLLLDRNRTKKTMKGSKRGPFDDLLDSRNVFVFTTVLYIALNVTLVIDVIEVRYASFLLHIITRSFMYSLVVTGCALFFPIKYFGSTTGLVESAASLIGLLQRPMFAIQQDYLDNDSFWIFIGLIVLNAVTFILPVYIHMYVKRSSRRYAEERGKSPNENEKVKPIQVNLDPD